MLHRSQCIRPDDKVSASSLRQATALRRKPQAISAAVVADRFDRTAFHGLNAFGSLFRSVGLFEHIRVSAVFRARKVGRGCFPAEVTIDALIIDVKRTGSVLRVFVFDFSHGRRLLRGLDLLCHRLSQRPQLRYGFSSQSLCFRRDS